MNIPAKVEKSHLNQWSAMCADVSVYREAMGELRTHEYCKMLGADMGAWELKRRTRGMRWVAIYKWVTAGFLIPPTDIWLDIGIAATMQLIPQSEFQKSAIKLQA